MRRSIMDIGALGEGGGLGLIPTPTEAAQMRPRHAARVQRPYGQIPTAIRPRDRRPLGRDSADTIAHGHARTRTHEHSDVTHTSRMPCRTGWKRGTLVYLLLAGPGCRPWARKPGRKKRKSRRRRTTEEDDNKRGTFCHRYVSARSDAIMISQSFICGDN